jgi:hypothetical protein
MLFPTTFFRLNSHLRTLVFATLLLLPRRSLVFGDVQFTAPSAGQNVPAGTIDVKWKDSGNSPQIADLTGFVLTLCVGGNDDSNIVRSSKSLTPQVDVLTLVAVAAAHHLRIARHILQWQQRFGHNTIWHRWARGQWLLISHDFYD